MENSISNDSCILKPYAEVRRLLVIISLIFLCLAGLTIFQDFLEAKRNGSIFYFNESALFKTVWFLFIPLLAILNQRLKHEASMGNGKAALFIAAPILAHLLILPLIAGVFSALFYEGRYDLYKFFTYALSHDLYKLILIYAGFVLGFRYFKTRIGNSTLPESKPVMDTLVINSGRENKVVRVADILQITSATPYIFIHLENNRYLHSETLKSIGRQLDPDVFVRVHKTGLVNLSKVRSFKSRLNGDYDLQLTNGDSVRLSRTYAGEFKTRLGPGHQVSP